MTFQVSPDAFFQVNTAGAELLYQTAIDLVKPTKDTSMLDICCGTGSIGLAFSKVEKCFFFFFQIIYHVLNYFTMKLLYFDSLFENNLKVHSLD